MRFLLFACLASFFGHLQGASDEIINLPGLESQSKFKQYAGYINVNEQTGRNLFYWFVEAEHDALNAPLAIWLTGGPGCSSMGGFFEELGPFWPNKDGKTLMKNPYSWNRKANIIFLDSPSGVGFSFSTNRSDYTVGDARTANDTYNFLQGFMQRYPQFKNAPLWITGESYGGHYVPNLAHRIVQGNTDSPNQKLNFQGFLVGNAWTYSAIDNYGAIFYWFSHALISEESFVGMNTTCDFGQIGPLQKPDPAACDKWQQQASAEMGNIDIYDIYSDVCLSDSHSGVALVNHLERAKAPLAAFSGFSRKFNPMKPCVDNYLTKYLNLPEVQKAIHANISYPWVGCTDQIKYSYSDLLASMIPVYQYLIKAGIHMLVYTGDVDAIVPVTGTRMWIDTLSLPVVDSWRPWMDSRNQTGGYVTKYSGLTFATVRNAGHLVPGTQPQRALDMFERFIAGQPL
eukprot:TRINITY_DN4522_c0_g1_i1.p1 TRINITY_DN4522_c0_g1~~TRINITY_DN4522_c0_g1_i1.p1  ORF type:complete len:469 (+),score=81.52 TRINITY_DN4522_c0_g1_i1:37-1407(+)